MPLFYFPLFPGMSVLNIFIWIFRIGFLKRNFYWLNWISKCQFGQRKQIGSTKLPYWESPTR